MRYAIGRSDGLVIPSPGIGCGITEEEFPAPLAPLSRSFQPLYLALFRKREK
jgi:hypothetical protein